IGSGEDREEIRGALPEGARIDTALAATIAAVPGVAGTVPDVAVDFIGDEIGAVTGREWPARVLDRDGAALVEGVAPAAGDVVLDARTARESGVMVGDGLTVTAPDGAHRFRVSGIVPERVATAADGLAGPRATA